MTDSIVEVDGLRGCARCGEDHEGKMAFQRLDHPIRKDTAEALTHWASCPTNGQPILMRFTPNTFVCDR